jgi:hypothetical protein
VPLAFYVHGLASEAAWSLPLNDRQASEVLLTSAQTLFLVIVAARMSISARSAMALFGLFALQSVVAFALSGNDSTAAQDLMSMLYVGAATLVISRDRTRLHPLLEMLALRRRKGDGDGSPAEEAEP